MRRATREETDRYLSDGIAGTRSELGVTQLAPFIQDGSAFLPLVEGREAVVRARLEAGSEALRHVLEVVRTEDFRRRDPEFYAGLESGRMALRVGHDADRTYAGYGVIVAELRALASHLQDARFLIREIQGDWVDDLRIEAGQLTLQRWYGTEEESDDAEIYDAMGSTEPVDPELRALALVERIRSAESLTRSTLYAADGPLRDAHAAAARRELAHAIPALPLALAENAGLELVLGNLEAADASARAALQREDIPRARFVAAVVAWSAGRDEEARAQALGAISRAPWMAEAFVLALGAHAREEREELGRALVALANAHASFYPNHYGGPWNDVRLKLLVRCSRGEVLDAAVHEAADFASSAEARGAALLLMMWGEALRLMGAHARARPFYESATRHDPLGGEVARREAWLKR